MQTVATLRALYASMTRPQRCKADVSYESILHERLLRCMSTRFWMFEFELKPNLNLTPIFKLNLNFEFGIWTLNLNLKLGIDLVSSGWFKKLMSSPTEYHARRISFNQDITAKRLSQSYKPDHSVAIYNNLDCSRFVQELWPCTRLSKLVWELLRVVKAIVKELS